MDDTAKRLKTVVASLEYTKVTVLVNDRSTEYGRIYFHKSRNLEILLDIEKPDTKIILFKKNQAEIYTPKTNQIQVYDLQRHSALLQQFLLLGFGTNTNELKKAYEVKLLREEVLGGNMTAVLELAPRSEDLAAQLSKVQLWISEESWLPLQQKFFEPGGDYLIAQYSALKVNRRLPPATFRIEAPENVKRLQMD